MARTFTVAMLVMALSTCSASAQTDAISGNAYIGPCKNYVDRVYPDQLQVFLQGGCAGAVAAHISLGRGLRPDLRFCPPQGVNVYQGVRVAVAYMEANPDKLHLEFQQLVQAAFRKAWPCQ